MNLFVGFAGFVLRISNQITEAFTNEESELIIYFGFSKC